VSRLLVVEDEAGIAHFLERGLAAAGFTVGVALDAAAAFAALRRSTPDLVILDLGLPDADGMEVLAEIRSGRHEMPVILLTARSEVADKVRGFEGGADDYLTKPFSFDELLMRVRARLREVGHEVAHLACGDLRLDLRTHRAFTTGSGDIELSAREFALLENLMSHSGAIRSREQLLDRVWGFDFDPGTNVVEVYISYLRRKIGSERIQTVRGAGYRMVALDTSRQEPAAG
jgi:DNA-binding response OmpR family regulator